MNNEKLLSEVLLTVWSKIEVWNAYHSFFTFVLVLTLKYFISSFPVSFQACLYLFLLWRTDWDKQADLVSDTFLQGIIEKSEAQHPSSNI